jgi:hypothetical protein
MTAAIPTQVLSFILGKQTYGVDILQVQEIRGWSTVTRIPHTPAHVLGVLNLRGAARSTIIQDELSSVVWGMPGEAHAIGASERLVSLLDIPEKALALADSRETPQAS